MPISRGLIFTIDGLLALTMALAACSVVLVYSQWNASDNALASHYALARDYLEVQYKYGRAVSAADFLSSTGFSATQTRPSSGEWISAQLMQYPNLTGCGTQTACTFSSTSANASFLLAQDTGLNFTRVAWVGK